MKEEILKILGSYVANNNDIDALGEELAKLFDIYQRRALITYENTVGCMDKSEATRCVDEYLEKK
jgi:hypothetical protein